MKRTVLAILMFILFSPFVLAGALLSIPFWYFKCGMELTDELMKTFDNWLGDYKVTVDWDDE